LLRLPILSPLPAPNWISGRSRIMLIEQERNPSPPVGSTSLMRGSQNVKHVKTELVVMGTDRTQHDPSSERSGEHRLAPFWLSADMVL
jgi:hypothetical protein